MTVLFVVYLFGQYINKNAIKMEIKTFGKDVVVHRKIVKRRFCHILNGFMCCLGICYILQWLIQTVSKHMLFMMAIKIFISPIHYLRIRTPQKYAVVEENWI